MPGTRLEDRGEYACMTTVENRYGDEQASGRVREVLGERLRTGSTSGVSTAT